MTEPIKQYIAELNRQFCTGMAREHSYRPALKNLLESLLPKMIVTNEPAHFECGAPDYIILREKDHLPVFFVEAKDIDDRDLDGRSKTGHKEQFDRYKQALDHILFTDYLDFHLYEQGELTDRVRIGEVRGNRIEAVPEAEQKFLDMLEHLSTTACQPITSAKVLAKQMAGKARLLENIIEQAMADNAESYANDNLRGQYNAFKDVLIHELKPAEFADIYAQTIAYGMFAARLHDDTPEDFGREEAARLIPKTNPFLRQIFNNLAGNDLDERIAWVVDDLVSVFQVTDIPKIMKGYSQNKRHHDPMIHFYEEFLSQYNPQLRKAKGVWYTPQPVVGFIVRAVDEILQRDFGIDEGLADYSTIERRVAVEQSSDKRTTDGMKHEKRRFHRVQILDPATGTGTFLAEVVNQIYDRYRDNQGMWQQYVEQHLLPRLNGFEILMASYAVAHLKLDMLLGDTGYQHRSDRRLHVYLTNSLEESNNEQRTLFAQWLSREASEANLIKRDCPVMVMIGNPPYSGESQNKGKWIMSLMESYKKEPGGKQPLNERNPKWLNDDYVKFIRLAQSYIEKNGEGVIGFINPHGYLDNPTFRGMRWNLLKTFDKIYTIDLHGNSKKKETCPDGSKDENVFDIMQGVSINIFVKTGKKGSGELGKVYHKDLYGLRREKYEILDNASLESIGYQEISPSAPMYFFVPKDFGLQKEYDKGFKVDELFLQNSMGVTTGHDKELVSFRPFNTDTNQSYCYRPFDKMWIDYELSKVVRPRESIMKHLQKSNVSLCLIKVNSAVDGLFKVLVTSGITDKTLLSSKDNTNVFPLYLYKETWEGEERIPNLNPDIVKKIAAIVDNASERCEMSTLMQRSEALPTTLPTTTPRFVDLHEHIQIRADALPHWHQPGKTQFVTFRLYDSMPQERLAELKTLKDEWIKMHPLPWDDATRCKYDKEVRRKTEKWLDNGYGSCILRKAEIRKIVSDALLHYHGQRYYIHHFVIMPNHIHLLITPLASNTVNEDLGSVKRFAANAINKMMGTRGEVWQRLVFDHMVRSEESYNAFVKYIKENPKNLPADTYTLFDASELDNASERCEMSTQMQRSEALPTVDPQELFDYIYAVLHSPAYRTKYKEFLKIDFPRIPYPTDAEQYHRLAEKGATLRRLHLMEGLPAKTGVTFPQEGSEKVECLRWEDDRVYINDVQYFEGVSEEAWNFYIGGYQPAQKWLKDRRGCTLSFEDVKHYQRIIYVLTQTAQIMNTIDE